MTAFIYSSRRIPSRLVAFLHRLGAGHRARSTQTGAAEAHPLRPAAAGASAENPWISPWISWILPKKRWEHLLGKLTITT